MKDIAILKKNKIDVDSAIELLGDIEMYEETLNDFLEVNDERIPFIQKYYQEMDMKNYAIQVHALKSDSKYLGFTQLADMALEHQLKSEEGDIAYIQEHYDELMEEVNRILKVVREYLAS